MSKIRNLPERILHPSWTQISLSYLFLLVEHRLFQEAIPLRRKRQCLSEDSKSNRHRALSFSMRFGGEVPRNLLLPGWPTQANARRFWKKKMFIRALGWHNLLCWFPGAKVKSQTNAFHAHKAHSSSEEVSLSVDLMPHYCTFFLCNIVTPSAIISAISWSFVFVLYYTKKTLMVAYGAGHKVCSS